MQFPTVTAFSFGLLFAQSALPCSPVIFEPQILDANLRRSFQVEEAPLGGLWWVRGFATDTMTPSPESVGTDAPTITFQEEGLVAISVPADAAVGDQWTVGDPDRARVTLVVSSGSANPAPVDDPLVEVFIQELGVRHYSSNACDGWFADSLEADELRFVVQPQQHSDAWADYGLRFWGIPSTNSSEPLAPYPAFAHQSASDVWEAKFWTHEVDDMTLVVQTVHLPTATLGQLQYFDVSGMVSAEEQSGCSQVGASGYASSFFLFAVLGLRRRRRPIENSC